MLRQKAMEAQKPTRIFCLLLIILLSALFDSCSSGKGAYKHGDYYQAVLEAVQRLRSKPDHKKSKEVLSLSYTAAVSFLETQTQNLMASNDNNKWRGAVQNYNKVNTLYEEIQRSPGALKVIPNPVSKYKELAEAKQKAAAEAYDMGLEAMLKNTREDAKRAYFLFKEANNLSPEYRESIEMTNQAKFNATLKVVVEPFRTNQQNWNFEPMVFGYRANEFVRFYTPQEVQNENLQRVDQYLTVTVNNYTESLPSITKKVQDISDSVKTSEKKVNNVTIPVYTKVNAKVTTFEKTVRGRCALNLIVSDGSSRADIRNTPITSEQAWTSQWAIYTGDARALSQNLKQLTDRKEPFLQNNQLKDMVRQDLEKKLANSVASFYGNY
jgi:hypothetical protein